MQQVICTEYPVIGSLISEALRANKKIHRSELMVNAKGSINFYLVQDTFILECDTDANHAPNEYYFFREIEQEEVNKILQGMSSVLGEQSLDKIKAMTEQTMKYLQMKF